MKAIVRYSHLPKKVSLINIAKPKLSQKEKQTHAIVKVAFAGICGRDLEHYKSKLSKSKIPSVLGHEFSGHIYEIHKKNKFGFKINDNVTCETVESVCELCFNCKRGFYNLCKRRKNIGGGKNGAFAKYIKVPIKYIHKLPKNINLEEAALIEPFAVCYNAIMNNSNINKNSKVLIYGAGTIGLICSKITKMLNAKTILVCTKSDIKNFKVIKKIKLNKIVFYNKNYKKKLISECKDGYSNIIDTVGGIDSTINDAIDLCRPGGQITKIGWFINKTVEANFDSIIRKNLSITGSFSHNYNIWEKCIDLLKKKKILLKDLISDRQPLENWTRCFNELYKRNGIKILLYSDEK